MFPLAVARGVLESTADVSVVLVILLGWLKCRSRGWLAPRSSELARSHSRDPSPEVAPCCPAGAAIESRVFGGVWYGYL